MKNPTKMCVLIICLVAFAMSFALPRTRTSESNMLFESRVDDNHETSYRPSQRQNGVLFVEDPGDPGFGPGINPDPRWDSVLTELLGPGNYGWFGPTTTLDEEGPPLDTMLQYDLVIWNTYDNWNGPPPVLTDNDQMNLGNYLLQGGKVWLIGQDLIYTGVPYTWMDTYFHLDTAYEDYRWRDTAWVPLHGLAEVNCHSFLDTTDYQANGFFPDELVPDTTWACHGVLEDPDSSKIVGIFYPGFGDWQSAFWSIDGRRVDPASEWVAIVSGMLTAFGIVGVEEVETLTPERLQLNISPDPFVNTTTISFAVPKATNVSLTIYNRIGQHITTLVNEQKQEGTYNVNWNRRDARGFEVPNGVYFVRLSCGDVSSMANLVVVK